MCEILFFVLLQVIKLYAWEVPFQRIISDIRQKELQELKKIAITMGIAMFSFTGGPLLVSKKFSSQYACN